MHFITFNQADKERCPSLGLINRLSERPPALGSRLGWLKHYRFERCPLLVADAQLRLVRPMPAIRVLMTLAAIEVSMIGFAGANPIAIDSTRRPVSRRAQVEVRGGGFR